MFKKRLFERIKDIDIANKSNSICSKDEQIESIICYINNLLSVRKGSYTINKNFGMENLYSSTDVSLSVFTQNAKLEIQSIITQYELRLKNVVVTYDGTSGINDQIFSIKAKLVENQENVILYCTLNFDGKITIIALENK
tara:strand:- start:41 stop:460 length:420 start_codon:yes stop_codon:yes gene_type:complete